MAASGGAGPSPAPLPAEVRVVNVGLALFGDAVRAQGAAAVEVDWRIPAGGRALIVGGWVRDQAYHDSKDPPADLPMEGETGSFSALVRDFSGDIPPRAIADELIERHPRRPRRPRSRARR